MEFEKKIFKAYAGKIVIDKDGEVIHKIKSLLIPKYFYENFERPCVGCKTIFVPRNFMINQGMLHWDFGMKNDGQFILYSIKTKKGSKLNVLNKLFSEVENIARIKGINEIYAYTHVFSRNVLNRLGWEKVNLTLDSPYRKSISL